MFSSDTVKDWFKAPVQVLVPNVRGYEEYRRQKHSEEPGKPYRVSSSMIGSASWPALMLGGAPDLTRNIDEVSFFLNSTKASSSPIAFAENAIGAPAGAGYRRKWKLVVGELPEEMCSDLDWENETNEARQSSLQLGIATGSYDAKSTLSACKSLSLSSTGIYKHILLCDKPRSSCSRVADCIGTAIFNHSTSSKQTGTLNPWYGLPGHPDEHMSCNDRSHHTDRRSVIKLLAALAKARDEPTKFGTGDYYRLHSSWSTLKSDWVKHRTRCSQVYFDSKDSSAAGPSSDIHLPSFSTSMVEMTSYSSNVADPQPSPPTYSELYPSISSDAVYSDAKDDEKSEEDPEAYSMSKGTRR